MEKTKLAICMEDEEYKQRFVKCVMKHYKELFEIHVVNELCELETENAEEFGVVIIGDDNEKRVDSLKKQVYLVLQEGCEREKRSTNENVHYTEKYQEVYKIMEELQKAVSDTIYKINKGVERGRIQKIGVFSLAKEAMQIPFAALLAEILGEKDHVLVVDLQPFSGMSAEVETEGILGMEDLISIASTENYTKKRLLASIGHEEKWEYVYPAKNVSCFSEVGLETYQKMLEILETEQGYTCEIINFGGNFPGIVELMESCQQIYILTEGEERNYREHTFLEEMRRRGKTAVLQKIIWMEIPKERIRFYSWKQIWKQWLWSSLGDTLRERYWVENTDGTDM